ncbi:MAG: tRNA 2-thiouridine(34) synthase MnmA [Oscillospiraceae bacterium]
MDSRKVLVGVSGGVDSSVCVELLKKSGYEVEGAVIDFSEHSAVAIEDAKRVCAHLDIPLYVIDARESFEENVVLPFCQSYVDGKTPNPCILCNPLVKFNALAKKAEELGIPFIATGHYAQVEEKEGVFYVKKAVSSLKDQSYMLYRLPQEILKRLLLPLGGYDKPTIRQMAEDLGLFNANKPDSQEICFIPDGDHAKFIEERGFSAKKGFFISPDGKKLREHEGIHHYTIGQRKGLNIALGKPVFIKEIAENGDIFLGFAGDEFFKSVILQEVVYTAQRPFPMGEEYSVKIRSASKGETAIVTQSDAYGIVLSFKTPVRAAAKGQSLVVYKDDFVVGGGFIAGAVAK